MLSQMVVEYLHERIVPKSGHCSPNENILGAQRDCPSGPLCAVGLTFAYNASPALISRETY